MEGPSLFDEYHILTYSISTWQRISIDDVVTIVYIVLTVH